MLSDHSVLSRAEDAVIFYIDATDEHLSHLPTTLLLLFPHQKSAILERDRQEECWGYTVLSILSDSLITVVFIGFGSEIGSSTAVASLGVSVSAHRVYRERWCVEHWRGKPD
jgi:hypothetical protein